MKTSDQYFRFPRQLLTSHAWKVLNIHERRAFDCLMEEYQSKSGYIKDGLVVTRRDFVAAGIDTHHITSSLAVLRNLGIVTPTRSMGGSRDGRTPNMYKPTFLPSEPGLKDATHDYLKITTKVEAERLAEIHRFKRLRKPPAVRKPKLKLAPTPPMSKPAEVVSNGKDAS
jgi:hypothetical protein